jgi:hypothetical protein
MIQIESNQKENDHPKKSRFKDPEIFIGPGGCQGKAVKAVPEKENKPVKVQHRCRQNQICGIELDGTVEKIKLKTEQIVEIFS